MPFKSSFHYQIKRLAIWHAACFVAGVDATVGIIMKRNAAAVFTLSALAAYASPFAVSALDTHAGDSTGSFPGTDTHYNDVYNFGEPDPNPVFTASATTRPFDRALRRDAAAMDASIATAHDGYSFAASQFDWHFTTARDKVDQVPEPASLALMGMSLAALGFMHRKKRN